MAGISFNVNGGATAKAVPFRLQSGGKASKPPILFAPGSDDETDGVQDPKRQRISITEAPSATPPQQASGPSLEEKQTAEKLAQFVAKNGRKFEAITRERNPHGGPFKFLFDFNSEGYKYYAQKVEEYSRPPGFLANVPIPAPPAPSNVETRSRQYGASVLSTAAHQSLSAHGHHQPALPGSAPQQPPMPPGAPPGPSPRPPHPASGGSQTDAPTTQRKRRSRWQDTPATPVLGGPSEKGSGIPPAAAEPAKDDSVAAMERFAAQAAAREQEKADKEAVVPLLNETSFDRRRVMAVFKDDGTRGHHMQDFIPKEELAKLLAKSGTADGKAQAEAIEAASRIQSDNIGHKLLSQMGWKEGQGLGASGAGVAAPVSASSEFGGDKRGLGAEDHTAVKEGDDEFEVYRKRMMLGYKHRPNPLGNPRKNYY